MTNIITTAGWPDVPQLETNTLALGGIGGPMNSQALSLTSRTQQLKELNFEALRRSYAEAGYTPVPGSFELGGTISTATDVLVYEANAKGYAWGGSLPKIVPAGSTPEDSGGIGAGAWIDKSQAFLTVNVKHFNGVWDGLADDTSAIMAAHTLANSLNVPVSYNGVSKFAIQADAQVPIKTSTDFCGAEIVILGGVNAPPSFNTFNDIYVISDDACPLTTVTGSVSAANLTEGAIFPTLGLFDGHGYAKLTCGLQVPNRDGTGTQDYTQTFKVNRLGRVSCPLSTDVSAFAASITVAYRRTSKSRLTLSNIGLTEGAWNNQRLFRIERCNTEIKGLSLLFNPAGDIYDNICEIIGIVDSSDVRVGDYITTGRPVTATTGSYCLGINGGADIYIDGMNALTGWGATGFNDVNGVHFSRSVLNRVDVHSSGHNVFADDCELHEAGMVYGWGGGIWKLTNSRLVRCAGISTRGDWGGTFFGSLFVDGVEVNHNFTSQYNLVDLATNPIGALIPVYAPKQIVINNITRVGKASANNSELVPVLLKVKDATSVVYSPTLVKATDINCHSSWRFGLRLDVLNMEANPSNPVLRIVADQCHADTTSAATTGVLDYDSIRTPTTLVRPNLKMGRIENLNIRMRTSINLEIRCLDCSINGLTVDTVSATQPLILLDECRFLAPVAQGQVIGGGVSGTAGFTEMRNCEIAATQFDFNLVAALIGNTTRKGATQSIWPVGVTASLAFTGWQKAGVFQA